MNKFLETYKINTKHLIQNNVLEFIDIFQEDKSNEVKKVYRSRLIKEIKTSTLTPTCRAFIMYMSNNLDKKINLEEIIIDKISPPSIIDEKSVIIEEIIIDKISSPSIIDEKYKNIDWVNKTDWIDVQTSEEDLSSDEEDLSSDEEKSEIIDNSNCVVEEKKVKVKRGMIALNNIRN